MNTHGELKITNTSKSGTVYSVSSSYAIPLDDKPNRVKKGKKDFALHLPSVKTIKDPADNISQYKNLPVKKYAKKEKSKNSTPNRMAALSKVFATAAVVIMLITYGPSVYYAGLQAVGINVNTSFRDEDLYNVAATNENPVYNPSTYQPVIDPSLPKENRLVIKSAGIDTQIYEAAEENFEEAMRKGVWREALFSSPEERSRPTILVAHRYGYLAWSIPYRLKNSFYNLPKLKVGDTVEVVWKQRKYTYAVFAEETSTAPSVANADLILYTCKDLNSDIRIYKYAKLLEI